ncbi:hypothetical protein [Novosphingobium pentaromativorans]|uniref:hypothetical protein n=1 Tax=Novosphingobium pentaromativorans TaxID=205844 RepID=UPI0002E0224B|nr:hypothetical protein [Novosphingobium pentaromativorans]
MVVDRTYTAVKPGKYVFLSVVVFCILLTITSLVDKVLQTGWGLNWHTFFIGFIASAWGIASYQLCASCLGWTEKRR